MVSINSHGHFIKLYSSNMHNEDIISGKLLNVVYLARISILFGGVYLFSSATNLYGFGAREYWLIIPTIFGLLSFGSYDSRE